MAFPQLPIYCDCNATTPIDPLVLDAMLPYFGERFGNPSSSSHIYGWTAQAAVERARTTIASAINADPSEIVFTSGATEANNLAIKGIAETSLPIGRHIITIATEHNAVLAPLRYLETLGFEVTILPVQPNGLLNIGKLKKALRKDTILVSVMAANNEIGVLQPLEKIAALLMDSQKELGRKIPFHTDAAQALGKIPLDVEALGLDLVSLTAHKLYGPKGVGALYIRRRNPRITLAPQLHGGEQERDLRSGTLNPPLIIGFAKAVELGLARMHEDTAKLIILRDLLWETLSEQLPDIELNGSTSPRLANNLNVSIAGVNSSALMLGIRNTVAVSTGSACSSANPKPSHVLTALGRSPSLAQASLRFGLGREMTVEDIDAIASCVVSTVHALRKNSISSSPT
ncbi:MAG: cysteine desulfurase family protein [Cyanobacteria bacterium P01_E01_bin.34]